jgi:hypothetical protein
MVSRARLAGSAGQAVAASQSPEPKPLNNIALALIGVKS